MRGRVVLTLLAFGLFANASAINETTTHRATKNNANEINLTNHLIVGSRVPGDRLVLRQGVSKPPIFLVVVTHTQTFNTFGYDRITQVKALDQRTDGYGASVSLVSGGPGEDWVTLYFESQWGRGINYVVELYAMPL